MRILASATSDAWAEAALTRPAELLADHRSLEWKASVTALALARRLTERIPALARAMEQLAREERAHVELVERRQRELHLTAPPPGKHAYTAAMRSLAGRASGHPLDMVLVSGLIEARSCDRFAALARAARGTSLGGFYEDFVAAEARHAALFVELAVDAFGEARARPRLRALAAEEAALVAALPARAGIL
jgi:tRNA-(ms[2]io[6]A)-hydroxylase